MTATPDARVLLRRGLLGMVAVFVAAFAASALLAEPLGRLGGWFVTTLGSAGLFLSVLAVDGLPTPLSYVPLMMLAVEGGMPFGQVFVISATASVSAGMWGYAVGRGLGMPDGLRTWLERKHPDALPLMQRHGAWGVAAVATLPIPFAIGTWTAGALGVRLRGVVLASLVRVPKTAFYLWMIARGLELGKG